MTVFSIDLPEPTPCVIGDDGDCVNHEVRRDLECTCKFFCGDPGEAGCCFCQHSDVYDECPRGGVWCDPRCGDPDNCCTPEQQAFVRAAREAFEALV